jgi:hypothetical protein
MSNCSVLSEDVRQVEYMMDNSDVDNAYVMNSNSLGFETWWWHRGSVEPCRRVKPNKKSIVISNNGLVELGKWNKFIWLDVWDEVLIERRNFSVWTSVQVCCQAHAGLYPLGTRNCFPEDMALYSEAENLPPPNVNVWKAWSFLYTRLNTCMLWCFDAWERYPLPSFNIKFLVITRIGSLFSLSFSKEVSSVQKLQTASTQFSVRPGSLTRS